MKEPSTAKCPKTSHAIYIHSNQNNITRVRSNHSHNSYDIAVDV